MTIDPYWCRENPREAAAEIERLQGEVAMLELTGTQKQLQSLLDQLGLDFERQLSENQHLKDDLKFAEQHNREQGREIDRLKTELAIAKMDLARLRKATGGKRGGEDKTPPDYPFDKFGRVAG